MRRFARRGASPRTPFRSLVPALAALSILASLIAAPARAGMEEWSTFDVQLQEEDDESLLDHFLTRTPREWREEWERAPLAVRTAQGCLTSGQWFIDTDIKTEARLGKRARFDLTLRQSENDSESFNYLDFGFRFPTAWGTPGAAFRPLYDKSRQDFTLSWTLGADTLTRRVDLVFVLEDVFNNLWAFRQTRVGGLSEPYDRRPYEAAFHYRWQPRGWRIETLGRWLTPSTKQVIDYGRPVPNRITTIWGTRARASVESSVLGFEWEIAGDNQQARSTDAPADGSEGDGEHERRRWSVEGVLRRALDERWTAETRYLYQGRDAFHGPPLGPSDFSGIDRMVEGEVRWVARPGMTVRAGAMHDRISIAQSGSYQVPSYGTRTESRAFIGLGLRFGNVTVAGVEGIELDPEPYDVWFVHDKGFLQLQATF